jgi:hypothetical protein
MPDQIVALTWIWQSTGALSDVVDNVEKQSSATATNAHF